MNNTFIEKYFYVLKNTDLSQMTEHSLRPVLYELLKNIAENVNKEIKILHEPKRNKEGFGSPDFQILTDASVIGYLENKKIGEDLQKTIKSEQIKKYQQLSHNILVTNYLHWIWLKDNEVVENVELAKITDLRKKNFKPSDEKFKNIVKIIENFFSQTPKGISSADELARELAKRSRMLKDFLQIELERQEKEEKGGKLYGLFLVFQSSVFNELTVKAFADAFAQMLGYGLFLAKLNADTKTITLQNVSQFIPTAFNLIRELVKFLDVLEENKAYSKIYWLVSEIIGMINHLDLPEIQKDLSFDNENQNDPYIYFYENFLASYDKSLRKSKGVYYTPPAIVNFIIRSINDILKKDFKIKKGFANAEKVTVLDFATGTGTFLLEILQQIFLNISVKSQKKNILIKEHILKNIYGFEYLIAPYTVAHLKLSQFLKSKNYQLSEDERLQIYLTNTLERMHPQMNFLLPALSKEGQKAQAIKNKNILVICGNPPYSGHSQNKDSWISQKIKDYLFIDGKPLGERNSKWLQDDYVKFIRFAQDKIDEVDEGIVGIITNHSFLDNPTFRGMRRSLMKSFDRLYFIDLHGNVKKKEKTPDGNKDENIFDIQQGVAISIFVKKKGIKKGIYHADFWGLRKEKYKKSLESSLKTIEWKELKPRKPFYLFKYQDTEFLEKYEKGFSVKDIFIKNSVGVVTGKDKKFIHFHKENLRKNFQYKDDNFKEKYLKQITYRPFDDRHIYYDTEQIERSRTEIMQHIIMGENIGLISIRRSRISKIWNFAFISEHIISGATAISSLDINYFYPLYLYEKTFLDFKEIEAKKRLRQIKRIYNKVSKEYTRLKIMKENNQIQEFFVEEKRALKEETRTLLDVQKTLLEKKFEFEKIENFNINFRKFINDLYNKKFSPEEILGYIYAILYSKTYRKKYADFLKMDFPKIIFTKNQEIFQKLSKLGSELIRFHLLNKIPDARIYNNLGKFLGSADNVVIKVNFVKKKEFSRLYINKEQYFDNVPKEVFEFYIGGYQVLSKYLKDRKNKTLSLQEIENVEDIVKVLQFTIKQMKKIEKETKEWI